MNLSQLNTLEGIRGFVEENKVTSSQIDEALGIAYGKKVDPDSILGNAGSLDAAGVLGLALHDYFPSGDYAERVRQLLSGKEQKIDLSLSGLNQWFNPDEFLAFITKLFPDYNWRPEAMARQFRDKNQWYSKIVEIISEAEGLDGVSQIIDSLFDRLGTDKRNQIVSIFKVKYPDLPYPLQGVELPSTKSPHPESIRASVALLVYSALQAKQTSIGQVQGFSPEAIGQATALMTAGKAKASGHPGLIPQPAGLVERLAEINRAKAASILAKIYPNLKGIKGRISLYSQPDLNEPDVVALVVQGLTEKEYKAQIEEVGSHGSSSKDIVYEEIGARLKASHLRQAQEIVAKVTHAVQSGQNRPEFLSEEKESLELAVASLSAMPALSNYKFSIETRAGYTGRYVIVIEKPSVPKVEDPKKSIEVLVDQLGPENIKDFERAMKDDALLDFIGQYVQQDNKRCINILEKILAKKHLFSNPVFAEYAAKLLNNIKNPVPGMKLRRAVSHDLPSIQHILEPVLAVSEGRLDKKEQKLQKLKERRDAHEIDEVDFDIINWLNHSGGKALTKADLGKKAVVLQYDEFKDIGVLTIRLPSGKECPLDADDFPDNDVLIIYPEDLG